MEGPGGCCTGSGFESQLGNTELEEPTIFSEQEARLLFLYGSRLDLTPKVAHSKHDSENDLSKEKSGLAFLAFSRV